MKKRVMVSNQDNELLHPIDAGPWAIGLVNEVNGAGAMEVPEFVQTRNEWLQLVKYWADIYTRLSYRRFTFAQTDSSDQRLIPFA